jgi:hypothetical protein
VQGVKIGVGREFRDRRSGVETPTAISPNIDIVFNATAKTNNEMATPTSAPVVAESGLKDEQLGKDEEVPVNVVNAVSAKKEPPPEKPEEIRMRSFVLLSFWAIIIFLGLPIWWRTTTIYRANLPLDQMMDWADGRVCDSLPVIMDSKLTSI